MELFGEGKGYREEKENKDIVFFEFDTHSQEKREEYHGIDITFWTRASEEKRKVDININISPRRGDKKEVEGMRVVLKEYDKVVAEGIVKTGFVTFKNMEREIYTIEFTLKEIKRTKNFDTYMV